MSLSLTFDTIPPPKPKSLTVPKTWPSLDAFTRWYQDNNYPIRVPSNVVIYPTDVSYSCCVFRQGVFQVELYLAKPNFKSTRHSHPFEQQIIFLGGHMFGRRGSGGSGTLGGGVMDLNKHPHSGNVGPVLPANEWHEIEGLDQGFIFFNCQKWNSVEEMNSAVISYDGELLGEVHRDMIEKNSRS